MLSRILSPLIGADDLKSVLLVCHGFPPNPGIGGRRWAKFAKYLVRKGFFVHVIACENESGNISTWQSDVAIPEITNYVLPVKYPKSLLNIPHGIIDKIKYRLSKAFYKITQPRRIYDKTFLWEEQFLRKAEEIIFKNNIKNVIVTGAPFYLMYYAAKLKIKYPDLNYIADYRDPWIGAINYGLENLSSRGLRLEQKMQNYVYEKADFITAPNRFLLSKIKQSITLVFPIVSL
jgi:hypothetical protein